MDLNARMPRIDNSRFSMIPRSEIPRSTFVTTHPNKTTIDAGWLYPWHVDEVLPGDVHQGEVTIFARLATLLFPLMDYLRLETFFFFVPNRLVWTNWPKMMGERANPTDSISYTTPQVSIDAGGPPALSIFDYLGIPPSGQITGGNTVNALPFRGYYFIWNEWFRDQNLQNSLTYSTGDGTAAMNAFTLQRRNKPKDYFTGALPWPLKGGVDVTIPMTGNARVMGIAVNNTNDPTDGSPGSNYRETGNFSAAPWPAFWGTTTAPVPIIRATGTAAGATPEIYADLSTVTGQTINALRLAFQTQRLLERDARGGTRYTELLRSHFGVTPEDSRLQRPEYIGGGRSAFHTQAIPQTSATGVTGGTSPLGALGAAATCTDRHSYSYHATEHGFIIGLINVSAELTYQQGIHRMWTRQTRYDYYWPAFAHLGEQAIRNDEIYATGGAADPQTFGYQERWAEYRYRQGRISGLFRSTTTGNIDEWHLAQQFGTLPQLNSAFIQDATDTQLDRVFAAGALATGLQILVDSVFKIKTTRAMPMYSVPGQIDRF